MHAKKIKITILRTPIVPKIVQLQTFFKISSFVFSVNKEMYTGLEQLEGE